MIYAPVYDLRNSEFFTETVSRF